MWHHKAVYWHFFCIFNADLPLFPGYTPGTPYKVSCSPTSGAVPPYSSSPNPYQTAVYPVRSAYPQQNPYAQVSDQNQATAIWLGSALPTLEYLLAFYSFVVLKRIISCQQWEFLMQSFTVLHLCSFMFRLTWWLRSAHWSNVQCLKTD